MTASPQRRALEAALGLRRRRPAQGPDSVLPDPKSVVTPDALSVAPELLGTPLAAPSRRLAALLLDLILIGFLQLLGWRFVLGGAALMLFLALVRPSDDAPPSRLRKTAAGCGGALVLVVAVFITLIPTLVNRVVVPTLDGTGFTIRAALPAEDTVESADDLGVADGPDSADASGTDSAPDSAGASGTDDAPDSAGAPGTADAPNSADTLGVADGPDSTDTRGTTIVLGSADTLGAGSAPEDGDTLEPAPTATSVGAFAAAFARAADSVAAHADSAAESRETGSGGGGTAFDWLRDAADEAGLVFGWGTVYITLFLALSDGRTPGKRVMDLRVVRVTGGPLGLLMSFERAGGYAAGLATGLLGFARVWWDPNRQAIHDKIAETVVIREKLAKVPGLGSAERRRDIPTTTATPARATPSKQSSQPTEEETP